MCKSNFETVGDFTLLGLFIQDATDNYANGIGSVDAFAYRIDFASREGAEQILEARFDRYLLRQAEHRMRNNRININGRRIRSRR